MLKVLSSTVIDPPLPARYSYSACGDSAVIASNFDRFDLDMMAGGETPNLSNRLAGTSSKSASRPYAAEQTSCMA